MKKVIIFLTIPLLVIGFIAIKVYGDAKKVIEHPFASNVSSIEVTVKNGDTLNKIISELDEQKKIGNSLLVKWYIKKHNLSSNIKPGTYTLSSDLSIEKFIKSLEEGKFNENAIKVTIPEGYDIEHIASLLEEKGVINKSDFIDSCKSYALPNYVKAEPKRKYALEGYLFPDTYEFIKGMKGKEIIDILVKNFNNAIKDIEKKTNKSIDINDMDRLIIMASIVERESELEDERPKIASVFYNRLKINMKLQSCATLEYALGVHKTIYSDKDTTVQSPYNTYFVSGMPVGPVCNPGKASIIAALEPAQTKNLYFVAKFNGTKAHFFSENEQQFFRDKRESEANMAKGNK